MRDNPGVEKTTYRNLIIDFVGDVFERGTKQQIREIFNKALDVRHDLLQEEKRNGKKQPRKDRPKEGGQEKVEGIAALQDKPTARDKADLKKIRNIQTVDDFLEITEKPKRKVRKKKS